MPAKVIRLDCPKVILIHSNLYTKPTYWCIRIQYLSTLSKLMNLDHTIIESIAADK